MNFKSIIEGLLFVSGEEGLGLDEICSLINKTKEETSAIIKELYNDYLNCDRGMRIEYLGNKFKLTTRAEHKEFYQKFIKKETDSPLSQSSLETLAIIAYNGPITRIEIDEIRGVNSAYIIRKLLLKSLVEEVGKSDSPGKPLLYNVTKNFLDYFGLGSINELPKLDFKANIEKEEELNLFNSKYKEEI
jgi:segregation and condensation protein B